jgi:hypothetical protein
MFGRKGSLATRSLFPLLVGFGSWCLGALITLTAFPTVPIDDQVLAILSIAPPVAAVVYAGWFKQSAPAGVPALIAVGAAALGAWLGFHVPSTPAIGPVTAIIGATLAANPGLIALDIAGRALVVAGERVPNRA